MASEAQKRATDKYDRANVRQFKMKMNRKTDADIIEWLESLDNIQGYLKELIRADIARNR